MKTCEICGDSFQESRSSQKFCRVCGKHPEQARRSYAKAEIINKAHAGDLYKFKEVVCLQCGKKIMTTYARRFCSTDCSEQYRTEHAKCIWCGTLLADKSNLSGRGFCSEECHQASNLKKAIDSGDYIECDHCGNKFIRRNYTNRFCSQECAKNGMVKEKRQVPVMSPAIVAKRKQERNCESCGEPFQWRIENAVQRFCSVKCREDMRKKKVDESNDKLNLGKDMNICTICKTSQMDCERFTSGFVYSPEGMVQKNINGKSVIISCPKFKK